MGFSNFIFGPVRYRYANREIYGVDDEDNSRYGWSYSVGNITNDPNQFNKIFSKTIDKLIKKAAYNTTYNGYATEETSYPGFQTLYTLVQCSPDVLGLTCQKCLGRIYRTSLFCCNRGRLWMMIFRTNCQIRYDTEPFYAPLPPRPSPSPPRPSPSPGNLLLLCLRHFALFDFLSLIYIKDLIV